METYLPVIKTTLSDWVLLTLNNPLYVAALATIVGLLTAIIYSIKVASLKKKNIASEKARIEMQNNLNTAQQQMQKMQEELTANTEQMQKDKQLAQNEAQRAAGLEEQLAQRNKQIAGIIQSLAASFDLGERSLPVTEDVKAEGLWQQHDRVITLLTTHLRSEQQAKIELQQSYQAETLKRAEKEALIETLQTTLATQTSQISKLEQALEEQKSMLQQQQDKASQVLSQTLEKHASELAHLTELEQPALELVNARPHLTQLEEKIQPAPSDMEQQLVSPVKVQTGGVTGKIKNLFGKTRQEPITAEPESAETRQDEAEIQPAPSDMEQQPVSAAKGQLGKLKNLFGKTK